jgi:hypothetical protein
MGDLSGMVSFGTMALKGLGMPANSSEALRLFQKVCARSRACVCGCNVAFGRRCRTDTRGATMAWDICTCTVCFGCLAWRSCT